MWRKLGCAFNLIIYIRVLLSATQKSAAAAYDGRTTAFVVRHANCAWSDGKHLPSIQQNSAFTRNFHSQSWHSALLLKRVVPTTTRLHTNITPSSDNDKSINYNSTTIANHAFRLAASEDLETIQERQLHHPLQPDQVFCTSTKLCQYGHPQAFGFHPTKGPKLVSGLFRLSCPLLCQAIDEYEGEGGVRQMSDWIRSKDRERDEGWKREGYEKANEAQKDIRMELAKDDTDKLVSKMGEYNAQRFLESGVAGIPASQTYNVKCVHAHVADHLCRCPSSSPDNTNTRGNEEGNIIGEHALQILEERGVPVLGNDVCWQQCNANRQPLPSDW
eukprot:CAMPEP_0172301118 /NCGR_PEP_ID=MMETSP1058-20130122/3063_1 /TAXON_ID=83371 /ORGANISM="Detonula confervacea, Strain CCMP 353" /LENGTH=330 /DNA_ID=CAMNT_0013011125 /DNA_START=80 /DNA_END=1069 /DNA_ORIENTATION=-